MQTRKSIVFIFILGLFLKYFNSEAQESQMKFGAYVDSYYAYDFSEPAANQRPYVTQYDKHNEFNINHGWIQGAYDSERVRASLAIQTGTYPANNYGAEPLMARFIYEAYAGYKLTKNGWLDVGVFGGHFGYESALSLDRELLSPALATEYTPYYQSGIRYTHDLSEKTQFRAVVVNGWQNIQETNNNKSVGIAIDHQASEQLFLSYGNYYGKDVSTLGDNVWRLHNNALLKWTPTDQFYAVGIVDWTLQEDPDSEDNVWATFYTLITSYELTKSWEINGRYEYVTDNDEILINGAGIGFGQSIVSLSLNYNPIDNATIRIEPKWYGGPSTYSFSSETAFVLQGGLAIRIE